MTKPTRTTHHSATLINHIVTNRKQQVTHTNVLPASLISDNDAPYICVNVGVQRLVPRFKMIRNERYFNKDAFIKDFDELLLSTVFAFNEPDAQIDILNKGYWQPKFLLSYLKVLTHLRMNMVLIPRQSLLFESYSYLNSPKF